MNFIKSTERLAAPMLTKGFHVVGREGASRAMSTTSLATKRSFFPSVHHRFSNINRMLEEIDGLMESSLSVFHPPPTSSLFRVQENKYKVSINAPNVDVKDIDLSLDKDGPVMSLKGQKFTKNGGMTVESRFESKILLPSDVDTDKISASISEGTLMIVAPKIDQRAALEEAKDRKVEIRVEEFDDSLQDSPSSNEQQQKADKAPEGITNSTAIHN